MAEKIIDIVAAQPYLWIYRQKLPYQVGSHWRNSLRNVEQTLFNFVKRAFLSFTFKREVSGKELVDNDPKSPEISCVAALLGLDHLRRYVVLRSDQVLFSIGGVELLWSIFSSTDLLLLNLCLILSFRRQLFKFSIHFQV